MHKSVLEWGQRVIDEYNIGDKGSVIELGAHNVNGSLRQFFDEDIVHYTGYDIQNGPGVDIIIDNIEDVLRDHDVEDSFGNYSYSQVDVVVCTEMLEHDNHFWETLWAVGTLLKRGGWFILSARGVDVTNNMAMFEHSFPGDYWRFMPQSVPLLMEMAGCEIIENHQDPQHPGFYALGRKK